MWKEISCLAIVNSSTNFTSSGDFIENKFCEDKPNANETAKEDMKKDILPLQIEIFNLYQPSLSTEKPKYSSNTKSLSEKSL